MGLKNILKDRRRRPSIKPGSVFSANMFGTHLFVALSIPDDTGNIPAVMINTKTVSKEYHVLLLHENYKGFLQYTSYCNCDQVYSFRKQNLLSAGKINEEDFIKIKEKTRKYLSI